MKKFFLFIAMMALASNGFAQNIYAVGYYTIGNRTNAALYKNGTRLYIAHHPSYPSKASKVTFNSEGDVYWMINYYNTNGTIHHSEIRKNNAALSTPEGFQIKDFYCLNDTLYTVCQTSTSKSIGVGAVLKGDDFSPYWQIGDGIQPSFVYDADVDKRTGIPYFCGYIVTEVNYTAAVWKENELHSVCQQQYIMDSITDSTAEEISVDNGHIFTGGSLSVQLEGAWVDLRVIWKDGEYVTTSDGTAGFSKICAFAGDIYYIYDYPHGFAHILYKHDDSGDHQMLSNFDGNYANNIFATPSDIYVCGKKDNKVSIWKNFVVIKQYDDIENITNIAVDERGIGINDDWYYEILNDNGSITYQHLECQTDTVIESKRPKVIVRSNTQYDRDEIIHVTHEYVYEENGKLYWWNKDLQEFTTLYDYAATQGEEWTIKVGFDSLTMRVDSVYYIENQGRTYRTLLVSDEEDLFSGEIASGIGHLTSFFPERLLDRNADFMLNGLRCFWANDALLYHNGEEDCEAVYELLHEGTEEESIAAFSVYPNPANGVLYVETHHGASLQENTTYHITNLMGQTLLQGTINSKSQPIDINALPAGMYFMTVGNETMKFVKQ